MTVRRVVLAAAALLASSACTDLVTDTVEYGEVEVRTTRLDGSPVPGVPLTLYIGAGPMAYDTTGAEGVHVFRFVPPNTFGVFAGVPEGYTRPEFYLGGPSTDIVDALDLEEGGTTTVTFEFLKVGPGAIEVALAEPDGAPVADVAVELYGSNGVIATRTTGSDGTVLFDPVPFGLWGIRFRPPRLYREFGEVDPVERDGLLVEEGVARRLDFDLEPCQGRITGTVRASTGQGVAGFPVTLYSGAGVLETARADASGQVVFSDLLCDSYGLRLEPVAGWTFPPGRGSAFQDGLLVTRGADRAVSFTVQRCSGTIVARVVDSNGAGLPSAVVTRYDSRGSEEHATTDATGTAVFTDAPCGVEQGVRVAPPPGYTVVPGRGSSYFDGIRLEDGDVRRLTFRLTPG